MAEIALHLKASFGIIKALSPPQAPGRAGCPAAAGFDLCDTAKPRSQ